ncbi:MAG: hypothetical protein E6767_17720 [Dysgonomonas sp.]|nr:hypothetical protein [Dysgonomonas sp.]
MSFSKDGFSLEFEMKLRAESHVYGHICRVVSDDSFSFDMISFSLAPEFRFILTGIDKVIETTEVKDSLTPIEDKWIKVKINFTNENLKISVNDKEQIMNHSLQNFNDIKIYFGHNQHRVFYTTDVPPMTIKNIVIRNSKNEIVSKWDLSSHNINEVYDEIMQRKALVNNPIWEIDKHMQWHKVGSIALKTTDPLPQVAYDNILGRVFIVLIDRVLIYHVENNKIDTIIPQKGFPYVREGSCGQIVYDNKRNRLISYNPDLPDLNFYSFDKNEWSQQSMVGINTRQHHNKFIDTEKDRLIVFGGYGSHRYNAQLAEISLENPDGWKIESLDSAIQPRYLSAVTNLDDNNILILGGYGSISGKQEESPRNYYDLHKLNINTKEDSVLWTYINNNNHFVFSNSAVVDDKANRLYALTYNNDRYYSSIYLSSFDINTSSPTMTVLSDSIKYNFLDIKSYCDLFLYKKTSSLYAIIQQEITSEELTVIDIYSLAFPPISKDLIYFDGTAKKNTAWIKYFFLITFGLLIIIILCFIFYRHKKKRDSIKEENIEFSEFTHNEDKDTNSIQRKKSTINLLGVFRIYDKEGDNITGDFSPTIKQILAYLLINSIKNDKGTTSQQLNETFWFGMDKSSASNNRRVNIRKLRLLLQNIGDIEITNKNNYLYIKLGKDVNCDYNDIYSLLNQSNIHIDKKIINQIVEIASFGPLLPNISEEWMDEYKAEFSIKLTETLLTAIKHPLIKDDYKLLLKIADVILLHDAIDEDAIQIKCRILYQMKQKGISKQCYDKFCEEYIRLLDVEPDFSYEDIVQDLIKN